MADQSHQKERIDCQAYIWDIFKDIHGVRPRFVNFEAMSLADLQAMVRDLDAEFAQHQIEVAQMQDEAITRFEATINQTIGSGAGDRQTAIRWLQEAHDDDQARYDDRYFECLHGLPYGYLGQAQRSAA